MRYRLQRHDGTDCSATMVPITVLRMVPIQRYRHDLLKNKAQLVHSRHRSITNFLVNLVAVLGAYCFFENKPDALQGYYIEDSKQLALF